MKTPSGEESLLVFNMLPKGELTFLRAKRREVRGVFEGKLARREIPKLLSKPQG